MCLRLPMSWPHAEPSPAFPAFSPRRNQLANPVLLQRYPNWTWSPTYRTTEVRGATQPRLVCFHTDPPPKAVPDSTDSLLSPERQQYSVSMR